MRRIFSLLFPLISLVPTASAVVWADDITNQTVLDFGNTARFRGVGIVGDAFGYGTGTFIGYGNGFGWVLTAKHVLSAGSTATFDLPDYGSFSLTGAYSYQDITVARLSATFNFSGIYTPKLNTNPLQAGDRVVSAGFGDACAQSDPFYYNEPPTRRGFQSVTGATVYRTAGQASTGAGYYTRDRFDAPGDADKRAIEGFGASGDSGSALIRESDNAILGVLSYGPPEFYGNVNYYSALLPEISADIYQKTGIAPVPEPASMVSLGLGVAALARRRRKA